MVMFVLYVKAHLENVAELSLPADHEYCIDVQESAGAEVREGVTVTAANEEEIPNSRGTANFCMKWSRDSKHAAYLNVVQVKGVTRPLTEDDENKWVGIVGFDCRGLMPIRWQPRDGFRIKATSGQVFEDVDLSEKEWCDFDEKLGESVGVYELEHKIEVHK
ncbi:hypothetical protein WJX72_004876 [[Myrmecia] bisecta]|uniref:Uncharacterized protein n=1 Tax=[Myrmecia] bisecta TaxID=41462 RepID=A0AAW1PT11_9CHLO